MKNWAPLIVVVVFIAVLAVLFGPRLYRSVQLKRSVAGLIGDVRAGDTQGIVQRVQSGQRQDVNALLTTRLPSNYASNIQSLRMTSSKMEGDASATTVLTCKVTSGEFTGIYQGMFLWQYTGAGWEWDFLGSYGAEFSPSGEPDWVRLADLIPLAE